MKTIFGSPGAHASHDVGEVRNVASILAAGGPNTTGWRRLMQASEVRHALKQHGRGSAKWEEGSRLSVNDLAKVNRVVAAAHSVKLQNRGGGKALVYEARVDGWNYTYSESIGRTNQRLVFRTMWRKK